MSLLPAIRRMTGNVGVRIALISVLMIGPLAAYQSAAILSFRQAQLDHALDHLEDFAALSAKLFEQGEREVALQATVLAMLAPTIEDTLSCQAALRKLAGQQVTLAAFDDAGAILCATGPLAHSAVAWPHGPPLAIVETAGNTTLVATAHPGAGPITSVAAAVPLHFSEVLRWAGVSRRKLAFHILTDDARALLPNDQAVAAPHPNGPEERSALRQADGKGRFGPPTRDVLAAFRTVQSSLGRLHIIAEMPAGEALTMADREARRMMLVWLALVAATGVLGWLATRQLVTKGVRGIANYAEAMADGQLAAPMPRMPADGELGRMTASLRRSMARLAAREAALTLSLEHWRVLAEHVSDVITRSGADGRLLYVSPASQTVMGYSADQMLGRHWVEFIHPDDRERMIANRRHLLAAPLDQICVAFRFLRPDGKICWLEANCTAQAEPTGKTVLISACRDITDKTKAEEELRRNESLFRTMAECAPVIIWVTDQNMFCSYANRACIEFLGRPFDEIMGRGWLQSIHPGDLAKAGARFQAMFRRHHQVTQRIRVQRGDGQYRSLIVSGAPRLDPDGRFLGYVGSAIDVTTEIEAARDAQTARRAAEMANASKTRFLAAASHDLRQPLHAINLFLDSLGRRVNGTEPIELVENIRLALASLNEMFGQLLDISRLEAGAVLPEPRDVEIERIMNVITPLASRLAAERGLEFRVRSCRAVVRTDSLLCERILRNLVTNAIRYTRQGGVLIGCRKRGGTLRLEVWDTGRGIPPERLGEVFSEFHRIEEDGDDHRGLGLGLTIVRRLTDLLGHRLTVASRLDRGSVFALELPLGDPANLMQVNQVDRLARGTVAGTTVAVIDDEPTVVESMRRLLEDWDCRVIAARRIGDLLSALERQGRPDIILADYRLKGGVTGIMVVEKIRSEFGANIPAIIITADTHRSVHRSVAEAGCRLLLKPLPPPRLRSLMALLLHPLDLAH